MNKEGALSALGFARKAGKLTGGFRAVADAVKKGRSHMVIVASDISPKSEKEIRFFAKDKIPAVRVDITAGELCKATGIKAGIFSISDQGFSDMFLKCISSGGIADYDKE